MSDQPFLKCPCQSCGGPIEFPGAGVGLRIECPHCGQKTVLSGPAAPASIQVGTTPPPRVAAVPQPPPRPVPQPATVPAPARGRSALRPILLLLVVIAALSGGSFWYFKMGPGRAKDDSGASGNSSGSNTNNAASPAAPASPDSPKLPTDLKAGEVKLEKAKSGNLFYAVGTVKNESAHQRFGVKVEIEFTDAKGQPAGRTTDYTQVIEPRQEWRFRALVLDAKAASGRVAGIKEDN